MLLTKLTNINQRNSGCEKSLHFDITTLLKPSDQLGFSGFSSVSHLHYYWPVKVPTGLMA
ncbi:CLUMA_CG005996, isoform A [Clunio marinus]|uniref:CLUMA_CG005996, isoform A n=1 Tax=Clunio marinus TaxID=568069 RepID=A0A1J1HWQ5_9DIPT|nr:CLUMA_CG005996, isoform A [Clunio marinus]